MSAHRSFETIPTEISKVYWCNPGDMSNPTPRFELAQMHQSREQGICWLDQLLEGGLSVPIRKPAGEMRALTILLSGPPGTGKSTFATELAYRWAKRPNPLTTLYLSTEGHHPWILDNAQALWGNDAYRLFSGPITIQSFTADSIDSWVNINNTDLNIDFISSLSAFFGWECGSNGTINTNNSEKQYDLLVVDSLNVLPSRSQKRDLFVSFLRLLGSGPRVILFILDTSRDDGYSEFWEYSCDVHIRLNHTSPIEPSSGYFQRTIEIVKARYQPHVWGPHLLKIYPAYDSSQRDTTGDDRQSEEDGDYRNRLRRAHPFRSEGGIFIFPSIHYLLSTYKRQDPPESPQYDPSGLIGLNTLLKDGYPRGRCTAYIGGRGGHKSHLGFVEVLHRLSSAESESALIVSLRDDVGTIINTMKKIAAHYSEVDRLTDIAPHHRMEIMYYPPGNISTDEFIHRMLLSVARLKGMNQDNKVTVLFNSVDQLDSRFPLCAKEPTFIAAIAQILSAEGISSIFVAASEQSDKTGYHGLESIAELIMTFNHAMINTETLVRAILDFVGKNICIEKRQIIEENCRLALTRSSLPVVKLKVERFAGGHAAGAWGILELVDEIEEIAPILSDIGISGLQCFPVNWE